MAGRVLAVALASRSGAAALAQKFAREARAEADLLMAGGEVLPAGSWACASTVEALDGGQLADVLAGSARLENYDAVVIDGSAAGREAAGRLSVRCELPVVGEAVGVRRVGEALQVTRTAEGGRRTAIMTSLAKGTIVVASSSVGDAGASPGRATESMRLTVPCGQAMFELLRESRLGPRELDLLDADVVVAGGRGMGGPQGFAMLEELAGVLGGTVGASRVAVDAGWAPYARQVGLTGKTVSPRLYIACGISGAPHHVLGMRDSSLIVAINSDPQAPIFKIAHVSVVGDVQRIVPDLLEGLRTQGTMPVAALAGAAR